jgi:hypothetical protein
MVYGNSLDSDMGRPEPPRKWPDKMEPILNSSPYIDHLDVVTHAAPGSTIITKGPFDNGPWARLVSIIPYDLENYTSEQQRHMVVLIHPSLTELTNLRSGDTASSVVDRAVRGIQLALEELAKTAVRNVIVLPMTPVAKLAEELQGLPINRRITAFNARLATLGITPRTMPHSVLLDPTTGYGNERLFAEFQSEGVIMHGTADGVHPGQRGQLLLAQSISALPDLQADLANVCVAG